MPYKPVVGVPGGLGAVAVNDDDALAGFYVVAVGSLDGTAVPAAWDASVPHRGFADAVVDGGAGVYTVQLSPVPTTAYYIQLTARTVKQIVCIAGDTGGAIQINIVDDTGASADGRVIITVTAVAPA